MHKNHDGRSAELKGKYATMKQISNVNMQPETSYCFFPLVAYNEK